jgi:transposase, IS30 family
MGNKYTHLVEDERIQIEVFTAYGATQASIARALLRDPGTISRELRRGRSVKQELRYLAVFGQQAYDQARRRAGRARRKLGPELTSPAWQHVLSGLRLGLSPQQIVIRDRLCVGLLGSLWPYSDLLVSHQTIYKAIFELPHSPLRREITALLRRSQGGRRRRPANSRYTGLQDITPLSERPASVELRTELGHWEGDTLRGSRNASAVGTLVERASRLTRLVPVPNLSAGAVLNGFTRCLRSLPAGSVKSLTYDRGSEMALHRELSKALGGIPIYFCPPYRPCDRGSNENTNGLLRQFLPKRMDLSLFTPDQLAIIEFALNNRPREVLGGYTPQQVFLRMLAKQQASA